MLISEVYQSNQGEGLLTGTPSVFIRFSGCNLRCDFCDTPFASWNPEGDVYSVEELIEKVLTFDANHIVITGGEPMIFKSLPKVCSSLRHHGKHITIETAGTVFQELECDLISISPKMKNSTPATERAGDWSLKHEQTRMRPDVVQQLLKAYTYQLKFVIDQEIDLDEVAEYLGQLRDLDRSRVLMMPQGITENELDERQEWLEPYCERTGFRFCDRMHIRWYGNKRGT